MKARKEATCPRKTSERRERREEKRESKNKMDSHGDMGLLGEHFDPSLVGKMREDGYESRSGSDNIEGASGEDQDAGDYQRPRKKYNRHTANQIQELESFFKECPHPDEKQRSELSRRLGLESKQIKFWFQNRRTQMKTQLERHENAILRQENDKLRAENELLKQNMSDPICNNCGGPVVPVPVSYEQQQLRIENARLKDELGRVCALANKFLGRPLTSSASPVPPFGSNTKFDLAVGRNGYGNLGHTDNTLPMGLDNNGGVMMPLIKPIGNAVGNEVPFDRSMFVDLALAAMDELIKIAQVESPIWIKSLDGGKEVLNHEEYMRTFPPCIGMKPSNFVIEATRESGVVLANSLDLVETLMDVNGWVEMFPSLIARAATIDIVSSGMGGTKSGALQMIHAEFQVISPFVPVRQVKFLRLCKQLAEGVWAVADVSVDGNQENLNAQTPVTCRRLPSGCIIQDMNNGCCKVTWVEHSEYDESAVHRLYRHILNSGMGFGAQRWIAALQRHYECMAMLLSPTILGEDQTVINLGGKKSMLKLARRMVDSFCSGVCASTLHNWANLVVESVSEDVRILTRKIIDEPGEPDGIVLSVSTSVWLPVSQQRLFDFLRDEQSRSQWDILSNGGILQEMVQIPKGQGHWNTVSVLRSTAVDANASDNMLILQETWNDVSGSLVVYAPVDVQSVSVVMNGGDSTYVALLPSGFVILPGNSFSNGEPNNCNGNPAKRDCDGNSGGGSFLTVGFQILASNLPSAKLTVESVKTVQNLISCTMQRIKTAFN
ncbi:PREDICTED: homeobox-leucine zipper protein ANTHOCYANINLESS 2-like isoform X1 [Populus euphratica]|uniref:Homeobox-leucine zipper protein ANTHOCYANINLESS 2-like isoform X1 n=2 Tax=Populus euphratica TaxID=75702 RepID=A0AAJ6VHU1_POPEU|nr:PREDICTED: homeobox-leucine zipper protein ANTHOCYANINLESS 2-like isoform X1 [Populus euphratica]